MGEIKILDRYPGTIGVSTNPRQVNQISEVKKKAREGFRAVEVNFLHSPLAQAVPKEAFKEIARQAKVSGMNLTIHGPVDVDFSGFFQPESEMKLRMKMILDKAKEMAKVLKQEVRTSLETIPAQKRIPVVFHSSIVHEQPFRQWDKEFERKIEENLKRELMKKYGDPNKVKEEIERLKREKPWIFEKRDMLIFLPEDKPMQYVEAREVRTPFGPKILTVEDEAKKYNQYIWQKELSETLRALDQSLQMLTDTAKYGGIALKDPSKVGLFFNSLQATEMNLKLIEDRLSEILRWIEKYGKPEHKQLFNSLQQKKQELENLKNKIKELEKQTQNWLNKAMENPIQNYEDHARYIFNSLLNLQFQRAELIKEIENEIGKNLARYGFPEIVKVASERYIEKASENVAKVLYEFLKEKVKNPEDLNYLPTVVIENIFPEYYASRGQELAKLIEKSRKKLAEMLKRDKEFLKRIGEKNADKLAKEVIGATWDVGHIYRLRAMGYGKEDVLKDTEAVARYVKHIHVTDNYGDYDSHLTPGQGEVPIKEMLDKIRKLAEEKGLYITAEIGGLYEHWGGEGKPWGYTLEGLGEKFYSELYPEGITPEEVYWLYNLGASGIEPVTYSTVPTAVPYTVVPGATVSPYNPQQPLPTLGHSTLPPELGGTSPRKTFSGLPTE